MSGNSQVDGMQDEIKQSIIHTVLLRILCIMHTNPLLIVVLRIIPCVTSLNSAKPTHD